MKRKISHLSPNVVWSYFEDVCKIPRPSKKEEKIIAYLLKFAKDKGLEATTDEAGNVLITKKATLGFENKKSVVIQSHLDMVCEKNSDVVHDFDNDAIQPFVDGEWVTAIGTTLGADDGIGIAAQMAILSATDIEHGEIECLFTVDEETGLSGAFALQPGFLKSKILINLDSEDEGELFIGCAGGVDTVATFTYEKEAVPTGYFALKLAIEGLVGGHSGDDINKGRGNANKIIARFLWMSMKKYDLRISMLKGGNLRNAIAREAYAEILVPSNVKENITADFNIFRSDIEFELAAVEKNIKMSISSSELPDFVIDRSTQNRLINSLYAVPHGVIAMSYRMRGMVETSTNLASVTFGSNNRVVVTTSQRSDIDSGKWDVAQMVESVFTLAGAEVVHSEGYPGWTPNPNSAILDITTESYERLFEVKPRVRSIHAGLECGLFLEKYPEMDMISFGPTLREVHSPDERIHIESVQKFWDLLIDVLKNIPEEV